jgi:hypothetical protein
MGRTPVAFPIVVHRRRTVTLLPPAEWLVLLGGTSSAEADSTVAELTQATKDALLAAIAADTEVMGSR